MARNENGIKAVGFGFLVTSLHEKSLQQVKSSLKTWKKKIYIYTNTATLQLVETSCMKNLSAIKEIF